MIASRDALADFRHWFDCFCSSISGDVTAEHWARIAHEAAAFAAAAAPRRDLASGLPAFQEQPRRVARVTWRGAEPLVTEWAAL